MEIFPGFAAAEVLYDEDGAVKGVATGDMGIGKDGKPTDAYQPGMELHAQVHVLRRRLPRPPRQAARGALQAARGRRPAGLRHRPEGAVGNQARAGTSRDSSCTPRAGRSTPTPTAARSCTTWRTTRSRSASSSGWATESLPLSRTRNSSATRRIPRSGTSSRAASASAYGARAISAGGLQSLPKLVFPGGALIGDDAGFLNASRIKGSHCRDQVGHARRRGGVRRARGRARRRRARRLSRGVPRELAPRRAAPRAQLQAVDEQRARTPAR